MSIKAVVSLPAEQPKSRWSRFLRGFAVDAGIVAFSTLLAIWLSFDFQVPGGLAIGITFYCASLVLVMMALSVWRRIHSARARYVGLYDFINLGLVNVGLTLTFIGLLTVVPLPLLGYEWLPPLLFLFLSTTGMLGIRIGRRLKAWRSLPKVRNSGKQKRALIVGAGDAGEAIMRVISRAENPYHQVVGFIDDDPDKADVAIHGVSVLGTSQSIPRLVSELSIEELLLAVPSASGEDVRRLVNICSQTSARVRTLPTVAPILTGQQQLMNQLREVHIEDLLKREPVKTDTSACSGYMSGESVLISGAGGSIGSELARQISDFAPANLVLLGKGENSIFEIEQELVRTINVPPKAIIADVRDALSLELAFQQTRPTVVFHAAAHKHVPLMQSSPIEAIRNNVLGTWLMAETSIRYGVKRFIYVSTDKAVKPTSIMGATKRVGEMIVRALADRTDGAFAIVRFGNVLGSRGSLIPALTAQIKGGGPVRITHPEMTRYFMTIPEAVQLILQAGSMGERGELFILDMGKPVKIVDLAYDLVRLHGLMPNEDIQVQFTGVRPGEKIHEELLYEQEELATTAHPKINMVRNNSALDWEWLRGQLDTLLGLCEQGNAEQARQFLMELAWGKTVIQRG